MKILILIILLMVHILIILILIILLMIYVLILTILINYFKLFHYSDLLQFYSDLNNLITL